MIFVFTNVHVAVLLSRGFQELQVVSAAIQTVLSTPVSVATALKGIQKTLGKALPFKVLQSLYMFFICSSSLVVFFLSCLIWLSSTIPVILKLSEII